jgi:hypothetical protein
LITALAGYRQAQIVGVKSVNESSYGIITGVWIVFEQVFIDGGTHPRNY